MKLKPYPKYKDSGVEWLGEVPEGWGTIPLKYVAIEPGSIFIDGDWIESKDISDDGIRYITTGNVGEGIYKEQGSGFISEETFRSLGCTEVLPGDVLISRLNIPIGRACLVPNLGARIVTSVDNVIVRPSNSFSSSFLVKLLSAKQYFAHTEILARGTTMQRVSRTTLGNIRICLPSQNEQTIIATFLDRQTDKLDTLIAKQEKLITLLQEKRQAIISHAVTKGLDPDVPMKDSGVEWLGMVPAHWEVKKLGLLGVFKGGAGFPDEHQGQLDKEIPFFKVADISAADEFSVMREYNHTISNETASALRAHVFPKGTIVFAKVGAALLLQRYRTLGQPSCIDNNMMGFAAYDNKQVSFLMYVMPLLDLSLIVNPGAVPSMNEGQISSQRIPVPPDFEIDRIVNYLDQETSKIDRLIEKTQRSIELAKEHRTALISAAVTGKIDVREAA